MKTQEQKQITALTRRLRHELKERGVELKHTETRELLSRVLGFEDDHALQAAQPSVFSPPSLPLVSAPPSQRRLRPAAKREGSTSEQPETEFTLALPTATYRFSLHLLESGPPGDLERVPALLLGSASAGKSFYLHGLAAELARRGKAVLLFTDPEGAFQSDDFYAITDALAPQLTSLDSVPPQPPAGLIRTALPDTIWGSGAEAGAHQVLQVLNSAEAYDAVLVDSRVTGLLTRHGLLSQLTRHAARRLTLTAWERGDLEEFRGFLAWANRSAVYLNAAGRRTVPVPAPWERVVDRTKRRQAREDHRVLAITFGGALPELDAPCLSLRPGTAPADGAALCVNPFGTGDVGAQRANALEFLTPLVFSSGVLRPYEARLLQTSLTTYLQDGQHREQPATLEGFVAWLTQAVDGPDQPWGPAQEAVFRQFAVTLSLYVAPPLSGLFGRATTVPELPALRVDVDVPLPNLQHALALTLARQAVRRAAAAGASLTLLLPETLRSAHAAALEELKFLLPSQRFLTIA